jgi:uncharacterized protein YecE (DUF72 family)
MNDPSFRIGTAGWSIPRSDAASFPSSGTHLERYASMLPAVEVNSSFHRPHRFSTYQRWAACTPDDFRFSVKLPREITHARMLVDATDPLGAFVAQVGGLGIKLGVVLVQLPPRLVFDRDRATTFFSTLRRQVGADVGVACEPRHASWFDELAASCMADHRVARVAADPVLVAGAERPGGWTGLRYYRLHGSPRTYYSAYGEQRVGEMAASIARADVTGSATWCIFDNTAGGAAMRDALRLRSLLTPSHDTEA